MEGINPAIAALVSEATSDLFNAANDCPGK